MVNVFLFLPIRFCLKRIGPLDVVLTNIARTIYRGLKTINASRAHKISKKRLKGRYIFCLVVSISYLTPLYFFLL